MKLRVNPSTGQFAQRLLDASAPYRWAVVEVDTEMGASITWLSDEQVAAWREVVLAPKPPEPEFVYALACATCDPHGPLTAHERDLREHAHDHAHHAVRYAVRVQHPDGAAGELEPGLAVTFHGSAEGDAASDVEATVLRAADMPDGDGDVVMGCVVDVEGRALFVPGSALRSVTD